jgi:hypothetical protein
VAERVPASLLAALADLMKWLDSSHIPSMVIGGVAALKEFAMAMTMPDLLEDFEKLVARRK